MPKKRLKSRLPFNPDIFRWARNRADYSLSEAAEKIKATTQQIIDWESRENVSSSPTVIQARKLADFYGRPFLEFFAKEIPDIPETKLVPDLRMANQSHISHENKILREVQAWGEMQRLNAIDLFELNGEVPPQVPAGLKATTNDDPERIAALARTTLKFPLGQQLNMRSQERAGLVKIIRSTFESIGILILKNSDLGKCKARGLCIYNELLPVIILSSEAPTGSTFTLCHEFAHIILRQSAVSDSMLKINAIEAWCDRFAGAFLVPYADLAKFINPNRKLSEISDQDLSRLANRFAVSRHAMLVRLVQLNIVDSDYYWRIKRPQFLEEEAKKPGGGPPLYYGTRYRNRNGDMYTGLVLEAWSNNRISNHNAAEFMGIKNINHLFDIRTHFND